MLITPNLVGAAPAPLLTLDEAKAQLNVQGIGDFDRRIGALIAAATTFVENYSGRALLTRTYHGFMDHWPVSPRHVGFRPDMGGAGPWPETGRWRTLRYIELPRPPLQAVAFVKTYDDDDVATAMDPATYYVDTTSTVGRIVRRREVTWPQACRTADAIEIQWTCGYGETADDVPEPFKQAALLLVSHWFVNRDAVVGVDNRDSSTPLPLGVDSLLAPYCVEFF
ncbi:MAG: head-tail connector protein [Caulobacteraceae bacterium]|nr:head-tail connector protein [Caulobacteraceae bacterium]